MKHVLNIIGPFWNTHIDPTERLIVSAAPPDFRKAQNLFAKRIGFLNIRDTYANMQYAVRYSARRDISLLRARMQRSRAVLHELDTVAVRIGHSEIDVAIAPLVDLGGNSNPLRLQID